MGARSVVIHYWPSLGRAYHAEIYSLTPDATDLTNRGSGMRAGLSGHDRWLPWSPY